MIEINQKLKNDCQLAIIQVEAAKSSLNKALSDFYQAILEDELKQLSLALECSQFHLWEHKGLVYIVYNNISGEEEQDLNASTNLIGDLKTIVFASNKYSCYFSRTTECDLSISVTYKENYNTKVAFKKIKITPGHLQPETLKSLFGYVIQSVKDKTVIDPYQED